MTHSLLPAPQGAERLRECYRDALSDDLVPRGLGVILDEALSEHPERAGLRVDDLMDLRALRDLQSQGQLP